MYQSKQARSLTTTMKVLFTAEEERKLFEEFHLLNKLAFVRYFFRYFGIEITDEEKKNERRRQALLEQIVLNFTPLIHRVQRQLSGYKMDSNDLVGEGCLALTEAAYRFDINNGNRFSAYAISWIKGMMMAFITKNYAMVNYCTDANKKALFFHLRKVIIAEQKRLGTFDLTPELLESLAHHLNVPIKDIMAIIAMFDTRYEGLDISAGEGISRLDLLEAEENVSIETSDQNRFQKDIINAAMNRMKFTRRERVVIEAQYLRDEDHKTTLEEVGKELNISKERVRQIRNKAHERLVEGIKRVVNDRDLKMYELF